MPKFPNPAGYAGRKGNKNRSGAARFATNAEAVLGTSDDLIISPLSMAGAVDDLLPDASTTVKGKIEIATDAEAVAGTSTVLAMTPHTVGLIAIAGAPLASEALAGIAELATTAEAVAVTDDSRIVTPLKVGSIFAAPPAMGSGTPAAGSFTTIAASGLSSLSASATILTAGAALNLGSDNDAGAVNLGVGTTARAIGIGNSAAAHVVTVGSATGAAQVDILVGTGNFSVEGANTSTYGISTSGADTGTISIGTGTGAQTMNLATGGTGVKTTNIGTGAIGNIITIGSATAASSLDLLCGTGDFSLDGAATSDLLVGASLTTGVITIGGTAQTGIMTLGDSSGTNIVQIGSGEGATTVNVAGGATSAKAVNIAIGAVANVVTIGTVSGAASMDLLVGTGNFTLEGNVASTYDISNTGVNTGTVNIAGGTGARAINIGAGGTGAKTIGIGAAASADVITIGTSDGAGSLDLACGTGNFTLEGATASTYEISSTGVNTGTVKVASGTGARTVEIAGGGTGAKTVNIAAAASADVVTIGTSDGAGSLDLACGTGNFTLEGATASTYEISSTGVNTGTCKFASGTGARTVEIAGGGTGVKTINIGAAATADVITVGTTTGAGSLVLAAGTGDITMSGTVKEIDAEFLFSSGTDLTVTQSPMMQSNATTGAAPSGANGDVNLMYMQDGCLMEQFIIGTQTIIAPRMSATGLDIELDNTNAEGAEYNFGARSNAKHAYTIGTSAAFFVEAQLTVEDISGCAPLMVGFRKVEANNATLASYTDYFCAGINTGTSATNVTLLDELNGGGQTATDSTDAWTGGDTGTATIRVLVSASGVCTYTIDGGAPSATNAMTFDNADVVMPFIHFLNGADVAGAVSLNSFKCGFQA